MKTIKRKLYYKGVSIEMKLEFREDVEDKRTIHLRKAKPFWALSITGRVGRYQFGQCQDSILETFKDDDSEDARRIKKICHIWNRYHMNDFNTGTKKQMDWADAYFETEGKKYNFTEACKYLEELNLLEDRGYRYGYGWLIEVIPQKVIDELKELFVC